MKKATAIAPGDVFAFDRYDGTHGFGRVVLDVENQGVKRRLLDADSPLLRFPKAILVDVFRESQPGFDGVPSDIVVRGVFISPELLRSGHWPVIGRREIIPSEVEFPENLVAVGLGCRFSRGEVSLPLALDENEVERLAAYPTREPTDSLVDISLFYSGAGGKGGGVPPVLQTGDLRFSPERIRIYGLLGEDPASTYHAMATKYGHDLSRFYR